MAGAMSELQASFQRLSERERRLVVITLAVAAVLLATLMVMWTGRTLSQKRAQVESQRTQLAEIRGYQDDYQRAENEEKRSLARLKSNRVSLFSRLNQAAQKLGLSLKDLNEREVPVKDSNVQETQVEVNLKNLSIDKLNELLKEIEGESTNGLVKVVKLKVKTRHDNAEMLDVTMTVATWKAS